MHRITAIEEQKRRKKRVNVFLEGRFAFALDKTIAEDQGLKVDSILSDIEIEKLIDADGYVKAYEVALRYLSYRPRSEKEVRQRLYKDRFDERQIEKVLVRLKELKVVDDTMFAHSWTENRDNFHPRGKRLLAIELQRKGIVGEVIQNAMDQVDEESSIYRTAEKKAKTLAALDYSSFRDKLGAFLQRRGYGYDLIKQVVDRFWQERVSDTNS